MERLSYLTGFGGHFSTEAVEGALPIGRNSPQRPPFGLYAEQLSGTAFTAPRHENRRSWLYRMRPAAQHDRFERYDGNALFGQSFSDDPLPPNRMRWNPLEESANGADWLDSMRSMMGNGSAERMEGVAVHLYAADRDMIDRVFCNADGELLDRKSVV